jgi:hypothetical protein
MAIGSGIFSKQLARFAHLVRGSGGIAGEIADLRADIKDEFAEVAGLVVEEFTNPVGTASPGAAVLKAATATVTSVVVLAPGDLLAAGLAMLAAWPRQIVFTTAGGTPADAPATADIVGTDQYGVAQTEQVALAQTATTATSTKYWKTITSITYAVGQGTSGTVAIGIAAAVIKAATATVAAPVTLGPTDLIQDDLALHPRRLVFTTAGGTPAHAPANAVVKGKDINGKPLEETVTLAQTGTTATSVNCFAEIESIAYPAGDGTSATIAISFDASIGLRKKLKLRAGLGMLVREHEAGSLVTTGATVAPATAGPNGAYTPANAANDARDYAIIYEADFAA